MADLLAALRESLRTCDCCGRPRPDSRVDGGAMHFRCWDEHHSDPAGPWPLDHSCARDEAGEGDE